MNDVRSCFRVIDFLPFTYDSSIYTHISFNNSIYDLILNLITKRNKPIDVYYADIQKSYNCYGFNPSIALQRESFSDIQNKNVNYKWLF